MPPTRQSSSKVPRFGARTSSTRTYQPPVIPVSFHLPVRRMEPWPEPPRNGAQDNLRKYLSRAHLPTIARYDKASPYRLPPKGRRTHKNKLKVQHDPERRVEQIRQHDSGAFNKAVQTYMKDYVFGSEGAPYAGRHYQRRDGEALVLRAWECVPEGDYENTPYPCNIEQTCTWIVDRPLKTMQRAIHLAFPDTLRWWVDEAESASDPDENSELWRTYLWRFHPNEHHPTWWRDIPASESTEPAPHESMVFAIQSPWILGPQDIKNFTDCKSLPLCSEDGTHPRIPLTSDQLVWAKLHDTCRHHKCPAFALTTYHGWVFGSFSEDWTTVQISEVKEWDAKEPNVMQSLVYWVASSMGLAGSREPIV